jgi:hypothetical protein
MGLILNQYAYLYVVASTGGNNAYCIPLSTPLTDSKDSVLSTDAIIQKIESDHRETKIYTLIGKKLTTRKNFDDRQKGAYYYLLKQHYVKNNKAVLENVAYADQGANVALSVFNLWHLIKTTVTEWNPLENHFYDKDIQLDEMERLISTLKKQDGILCKPQINDLYLSYHLKMLYYFEHFPQPGNPVQARYIQNSLRFITNYYKARSKNINSTLSLHIIKQLNLFNLLPGNQPGARYGHDLLNAIAASRILNNEEFKIYAHYQKIFNPQLKSIPALYTPQMIKAVWDTPF